MVINMERDEIIEVLGKSLLLGIECVIDDIYIIRLSGDNQIELVDLKVTEEVYKYLRSHHMTFEFPECIDIFADSCLEKLPKIVQSYFNQNYNINYKIGFYFKFPSHLTQLYTHMFIDFGLYNFEHVTIHGLLAENIVRTNILNTLLNDIKCIYLPSMDILYNKRGFGYVNFMEKDCIIYFKDFIGTIGTFLLYDKFKDSENEYNKYLNIVSKCVKKQFLDNKYCHYFYEYIYNEIFSISLCKYDTNKEFNPGVNITLLSIVGITSDSDSDKVSNISKEIFSSGILKIDDFISEIDNHCFHILDETQDKLGELNIELPKMLQKLDSYTFKNLKILKTLTIKGTPYISKVCLCGCDNLECINSKDYSFEKFDARKFICNDSVKLNLLDWSGTIGEFKNLKEKTGY